MNRLVVGLAGGVGGGKTFVAGLFKKQGAEVVDADALGHRALERPAVRRRLVRAFGPGILGAGGRIRRPALARAAFRSRAAAGALNRIVHPPVLREIRRRIARARGWVVLDAALLFEAGADALCDRTVFVSAPRALRRRRTASRGWPPGELARREGFQWAPAAKRRRADFVIDNSDGRARTERRVRRVIEALRGIRPRRHL